jgi:hypothetical protein
LDYVLNVGLSTLWRVYHCGADSLVEIDHRPLVTKHACQSSTSLVPAYFAYGQAGLCLKRRLVDALASLPLRSRQPYRDRPLVSEHACQSSTPIVPAYFTDGRLGLCLKRRGWVSQWRTTTEGKCTPQLRIRADIRIQLARRHCIQAVFWELWWFAAALRSANRVGAVSVWTATIAGRAPAGRQIPRRGGARCGLVNDRHDRCCPERGYSSRAGGRGTCTTTTAIPSFAPPGP